MAAVPLRLGETLQLETWLHNSFSETLQCPPSDLQSDLSQAIMEAKGIDLAALLRFDQEQGQIWLKDYRMVLMSACALGALRRELIETLGWERARGAMKRFGHAAGLADGHALAERFPEASIHEHLDFGPALHGLEGVTNIIRIPERSRIDPENGELHIEAYWENSYEAEQHLELFGQSAEPVCWTLIGYATGHSSSAVGKRTVVVETECRAMGHEHCRFTLGYACEMKEDACREEPDYEKDHLPEVLKGLLGQVKSQSRSLRDRERRISNLENELAQYRSPGDLVGESPQFEAALMTARKVAPVDATVLVLGESGTGKEVVARVIHDESLRRDEPFVAMNCSALPETLREAELFGYAKGAFTGAATATAGVFEAAHGGTLFLDEVGDLAPSAQTKILRVLQEREIKRLGETRIRKVDVRVLAATNRDLQAMLKTKEFREDLYYRLSVVTIGLPPLRERGVDRLLFADHFLAVYADKFSRPVRCFARSARAAILAYSWPGNVRELQHAIERSVIMSVGEEVRLEDLPAVVAGKSGAMQMATLRSVDPSSDECRQQLDELTDERARISKALEFAAGNRERAADLLRISRTTLWRRMKAQDLYD